MSDRLNGRYARGISAALGIILAFDAAYAASNWVVGVSNTVGGQAQSATISNLTIAASATPAITNGLYPGSTGDVVLSITNPNTFPVTLTDIQVPANTAYAAGYSDSGLATAVTGCSATTSLVTWTYSTGTSGTSHHLTTALTVAAKNSSSPLLVTLTGAASMGTASPLACAGIYFAMPALTGITASSDVPGATVTSSPATDS